MTSATTAGPDPDGNPPDRRWPGVLWRALAAAVVVPVASAALLGLYVLVLWLRLPTVAALPATGDPGPTAFMTEDRCQPKVRDFVSIDEVDPRLVCAVVWAEDWRFFQHDGVDWRALEQAVRDNWRRSRLRVGGSTIPMQLARNLFLTRARTVSRKLREIFLARRLVARFGHKRVMEMYLSAAEWAPCVYGIEAAAQHYFGHDARVIDAAEAVFLASMLPRPSRPPGLDAADRKRLLRRQQELLTTLGQVGLLAPATVRKSRAAVFANLAHQSRDAGRHTSARDARPGPAEVEPDTGRDDLVRTPKPSVRLVAPASVQWLTRACGTLPGRGS